MRAADACPAELAEMTAPTAQVSLIGEAYVALVAGRTPEVRESVALDALEEDECDRRRTSNSWM